MPGMLHHEQIYRGADRIHHLAEVPLVLCGAGALGSHLADNLTRQGFRSLRVIDRDRVEEHNVGTQLYGESEIGAWKVEALRTRLFRALGVEIEGVRKSLDGRTAPALLKGAGLVIDAFDNSKSRQLVQDHCRDRKLACLHVGLASEYAEVIWDERYRVPGDVAGDVCDYPMARNLILLAVAVASETLVRAVLEGVRQDWSITLGDFAIRAIEPNNNQ